MKVSYLTKIRWSVKRRGIAGTLRLAVLKAPRKVEDWVWDRLHCVDTGRVVEIENMNVRGDNVAHGIRYQATPSRVFRGMIRSLDLSYEEFTFVDFGSGKGRLLLLASEFPFRSIVGIEFAPELHHAAERNIESFRGPKKCRQIESICMDAGEYRLTPGKYVLFFNFPFREPVMRAVVAMIDGLLRRSESEVILVNYEPSPAIARILDADPLFHVVGRSIEHAVYRSRSDRAPAPRPVASCLTAGAPSSRQQIVRPEDTIR